MKASELMINDWVVSNQNKNVYQIDPVIMFRIIYSLIKKDTDIDNHIKPITLTEKILLDNGFNIAYKSPSLTMLALYDDNEDFCLYCNFFTRKPEEVKILIETNKPVRSSIETTINFVHEFQHALRMCGFNELANNLKIENIWK